MSDDSFFTALQYSKVENKRGIYKREKTIMTTIDKQIEEKNKIIKGLEKVYEKLIEFKRSKNSVLVVIRDNKIVKIRP